MSTRSYSPLSMLLSVCLLVIGSFDSFVRGQDPAARTAGDPVISIDNLALLLRPLTKTELAVEVEAWLALVRAEVEDACSRELEISRKELAADQAFAAASALRDVKAALDAAATAPTLESSQAVTEARAAAKEAVTTAFGGEPRDPAAGVDIGDIDLATAAQLDEWAKRASEAGDAHEAAKANLAGEIVEVHAKRNALVERANAVIDELELKGGEVKDPRIYLGAVSVLAPIDVSDASTAWITIKGWLLSEEGGIKYGLRLLKALIILAVFWALSRVIANLVRRVLDRTRRVSQLLRDVVIGWLSRVVLIVGLVIAVTTLGFDMTPVLALIGAAGLVIGLALQGTLGNFASGLLILFYRPFDMGDLVDVAGVTGHVEALNIMCTKVRTWDNKLMVIQNNSVWGNIITNQTGQSKHRRVDMVFGVGYTDDIDKAQEILESIVAEHDLVLASPEPQVKLHQLADSSVNFVVRPWSKPEHYWDVYWDVTRAVKKRFDQEGVSIPFPQRDVHLYQE